MPNLSFWLKNEVFTADFTPRMCKNVLKICMMQANYNLFITVSNLNFAAHVLIFDCLDVNFLKFQIT